MQLLFNLLVVFIVLNCLFKLSFLKVWQTIVFAALCAGFIIVTYNFASQQSKTELAAYLNNPQIMSNVAVLVTIESAICISFCIVAIKAFFGKPSRYYSILKWFISLLIFPALFYALAQLMFSFSGVSFAVVGWSAAAVVMVAMPLLSYLIKKVLPEEDLRLEIHFMVSLAITIIGLISTVNGNVTYAVVKEPFNLKALLLSIGLFAVTFIFGIVWHKIKFRIKKPF